MCEIIVKKIEQKNIIWFENSNSYLLLEDIVAKIILKIQNNVSVKEIKDWCTLKLVSPKDISHSFVDDVVNLYKQQTKTSKNDVGKEINYSTPNIYYSSKYYLIHETVFFMQFQTEYHESLIHPKFAHLEITSPTSYQNCYQIFEAANSIIFFKNKTLIKDWTREEAHLFQGKLSMHILIDIYKIPENNWLGVFHASAITDKKNAILLLGDSGNGKSTSLALLNAHGIDCLADDFVPVDSHKKIRSFPAAISVKKNSVQTLLPYYPNLKETAEFHFKRLQKIVRYLPVKNINYNIQSSCKALIFIKYNKEVELEISLISKTTAFEKLIPDSWISPIKDNVNLFLDWFLELPCYQLTYSNNQKMIATVKKIFADDL
ncbi:MAG: hypothetical protein HWD85_10005 [Flavobacteriaceae bacterium]|nr:hypothetical protein [Flavobacteriaceae bacterium]